MSPLALLAAVVLGWMIQLWFSYKQSMAFNKQVLSMRKHGVVSVGAAGKRYAGGRAFVAIAVDADDILRDAISISGWTTFARGKPLPALFDVKLSHVRGDKEFAGLSRQQREAARQAADLYKTQRATPA